MDNAVRLDVLLAAKGLAKSRRRAKELIEEGKVYADGKLCLKPALLVPETASLEVRGERLRYVGRGGLKLEHALGRFGIALDGCVCVDVGASTGGFTDCMLQHGASRVYAVDVGTAQLDASLRRDRRVICLEQTDARSAPGKIPEPADFVSADVSFISLTLILPHIKALLKPGGRCVLLIKPQFEAGREHIGKNGLVRSPKVHADVLMRVCGCMRGEGLAVRGLTPSPVKGGDNNGNTEYLAFGEYTPGKDVPAGADTPGHIAAIVAEALG